MKIKRISQIIISLLVFIISLVVVNKVFADDSSPYRTYSVNGYGRYVETQTAYETTTRISKIGDTTLKQASDLKIGPDNNLFIADTGNHRVVVITKTGELVKEIGKEVLKKPTGIFVTDNGKVFVADETAGSVFVFDNRGNLIHTFKKPTSLSFGKTSSFAPIKVTVDNRENVYVTSRGNNNGLIILNASTDDPFLGYFAPNEAIVSAMTLFRKAIFSEEQKDKMIGSMPNSAANINIDKDGLIYTVTPAEKEKTIKKLNMAGKNIIETSVYDDFPTSVSIGSLENIFVASEYGYIYEYTSEGDLLFVFGGTDDGKQRKGLFGSISAIASDNNNRLYTLDPKKDEIQVFQPTEFANRVHKALTLYQNGKYIESKQPWQSVLKMNNLFDFANLGLGEAYFKDGNYQAALKKFRSARDVSGYSDSFWEIRNKWISQNMMNVLLILLAVFIFSKFVWKWIKNFKIFNPAKSLLRIIQNNKLVQQVTYVFYFIKNPADALYGLKKEQKTSNLAATIILAVIGLIYLCNKYLSGFIFKTVRDGKYEIPMDTLMFLAVVFFVVTATYLICTITDGEASYSQLYRGYIYSCAPYILIKPFQIAISNVLTINETFVITFSNIVIYVWVATLMVLMIKQLNSYTGKETTRTILYSAFAIFIGVVILFVNYTLINQVVSFASSLFGEVVQRFGKG